MQAQAAQSWRRGGQRPPSTGGLGRAIRYLGKQRRSTFLAYGALVVATLAQLAVPQLVQSMLNAVTGGAIAPQILGLPALMQSVAAAQTGYTLDELRGYQANAETWLISAALFIVIFA